MHGSDPDRCGVPRRACRVGWMGVFARFFLPGACFGDRRAHPRPTVNLPWCCSAP